MYDEKRKHDKGGINDVTYKSDYDLFGIKQILGRRLYTHMKTFIAKRTVTASKQIIVDLPQCHVGDEVELIILVNTFSTKVSSEEKIFDMEQWANQWETDLGEDIQSADVAHFTGRSF